MGISAERKSSFNGSWDHSAGYAHGDLLKRIQALLKMAEEAKDSARVGSMRLRRSAGTGS